MKDFLDSYLICLPIGQALEKKESFETALESSCMQKIPSCKCVRNQI